MSITKVNEVESNVHDEDLTKCDACNQYTNEVIREMTPTIVNSKTIYLCKYCYLSSHVICKDDEARKKIRKPLGFNTRFIKYRNVSFNGEIELKHVLYTYNVYKETVVEFLQRRRHENMIIAKVSKKYLKSKFKHLPELVKEFLYLPNVKNAISENKATPLLS